MTLELTRGYDPVAVYLQKEFEFRQKLMGMGLTRKESEVAIVFMQSTTNKEIAQKLFVSEKCIKIHLTSIYRKFNVKNRYELLKVILGMNH